MTENDRTSHTDAQQPQVEPTLRGLLEQPKGVLQKNLKTFVYLGAALLVIVAALFSSTGKKTPAQQAAAKGQPPQPTLQDNTDNNVQDLKNQVQAERAERAAGSNGRRCRARSGACVCDARATGRRRGLWPKRRGVHFLRSRPALRASAARQPCRRNLLPRSNKRSSLPRKSANGPTTPDSLPTLCTPALPSNSRSSRKPKVRRCPSSMTIPSGRQRRISLTHRPKKNRKRHAEAINGLWKRTLIRPSASPISSTKVRFSTRF